jgi:hypothetical protein
MKRWRLPDLKSHDRGFGDGLSAAFELVVTPAIFGFLGFLLDRVLGTVPLFTLVFSVAVLVYMVWKFWAQYMRDSEAELERWRAARAAARSAARHTNG